MMSQAPLALSASVSAAPCDGLSNSVHTPPYRWVLPLHRLFCLISAVTLAVGATTDEQAQGIEHTPNRNAQAVGHLGRRQPVATPTRENGTELDVAHRVLTHLDPAAATENRALAQQIHAAELASVVTMRHRDPTCDELLATWQH
jgi:hypothetical protein